MRLRDLTRLVESTPLGAAGEPALPRRDDVRFVQGALREALGSEDFVLDCFEAALAGRDPRDTFLHVPSRGVRARLMFWAPGFRAGPHEHAFWTVTGVVFNALEIDVFDVDAAVREQRLAPKIRLAAPAGSVGHIYDRGIHDARNPTARGAISIHIFHANDVPWINDTCGPISGIGLARPTRPTSEHPLSGIGPLIARAIASFRSTRADAVLRRICSLADPATQLIIARVLVHRGQS